MSVLARLTPRIDASRSSPPPEARCTSHGCAISRHPGPAGERRKYDRDGSMS
jgi:hypothetical protein